MTKIEIAAVLIGILRPGAFAAPPSAPTGFCLGVGCGASGVSSSSQPPSSVGSNSGIMWGLNGHPLGKGAYANIPQQMQLLNSLGVKHYRVDFYNPSADQYAVMTQLLAAAAPYGIVVTPILIMNQTKSYASETAAYSAAYAMGSGWASTFKGQVKIYEAANEENGYVLNPFQDNSSTAVWESAPYYPQARGVMRGLVDGIHSAGGLAAAGDAGGCNYGFSEALWQDGVRWDITVIHPYDFWGNPTNLGVAWSTTTVTSQAGCVGGNDMLGKHAQFGKPLWLTEFNDTPGVDANNKTQEGLGLVQMMMPDFVALASKYDIEEADIYELFDDGQPGSEGTFGLFTYADAATPASVDVGTYIGQHPSMLYTGASSMLTPLSTGTIGSFGLTAGQTLDAGTVSLSMQTDGNLVLYNNATGGSIWASGTSGKTCTAKSCSAQFQPDGNFVLYQNGSSYWASGSAGNAGAIMSFLSAAPFIEISTGTTIVWSGVAQYAPFGLAAGSSIQMGPHLILTYQTDGNLVVYNTAVKTSWQSVWSSATGGKSCSPTTCSAQFQTDGNFVLYLNGTNYWASGTSGHANSLLQLNTSAPYLQIKGSTGAILWSSTPNN